MLGGVEAKTLEELPRWAMELLARGPVARLGFLDPLEDRVDQLA